MHVLVNLFCPVCSGSGVPCMCWLTCFVLCVQGLVFHACVYELVLFCVLGVGVPCMCWLTRSGLCFQGLVFQLWSVCSGFGVPTLVCVFRVWCSNSGLCVQGLVFQLWSVCPGFGVPCMCWWTHSGLCVEGLVFHADVDALCSVCSGSGVPCMCWWTHSGLCVQDLVFHACVDELVLSCVQGLDKEWPSLTALVTHHTVMPEMLPCTLRLPRNNKNLTFREAEREEPDEESTYQRLTDVTAMAGQLKLWLAAEGRRLCPRRKLELDGERFGLGMLVILIEWEAGVADRVEGIVQSVWASVWSYLSPWRVCGVEIYSMMAGLRLWLYQLQDLRFIQFVSYVYIHTL